MIEALEWLRIARRMQFSAGIILGSLALAACAEMQWVHPTADPSTVTADRQSCDQVARVEAQQQVLFERLSGPRPVRNGVIGYPTGDGFYGRNSEWYWTQYFFDSCMRSKGYRLTRIE